MGAKDRFFIIGVITVLIGLGIIIFSRFKIPFPLGKLPGDFLIKKDNFTFYFPLASSLLVSIILSIIFYFLSRR